MDHCNWGHKLVRFEEQIANPASQLATKMSSAPEQYRWEWYEHINGKPNIVIRKWGLEALTVLDIETHNKISTTKYRELPNDRKIGGLLFVMYPELFRHGREEKKDILIEKAVVVVHTNDQQPSAQLSVEPSAQPSVQSSVQPSAQLSAEPGTQPRIKIEVDSSEKKT